jgi:uncharacterized protein with NRDE domain
LTGAAPPSRYIESLEGKLYSGFNLLLCDGNEFWWFSNRDGTPRRLEPGIYGLGNLLLDSPEVEPDKARLRAALDPAPALDPLFASLSPARIVHPEYGTRCSTVLLQSKDRRIQYAERGFSPDGSEGDTVQFEFSASGS